MRTFLFGVAAILLTLWLCGAFDQEKHTFTGYVVHKEWTKGHMSDQTPARVNYAAVYVPHPVVVHKSSPTWQKSSFKLFVANRDRVREFEVDSAKWFTYRICQRVTFAY